MPETTTIRGTVYGPSGAPVPSGRLRARISRVPTEPVVASPVVIQLGPAGAVDFALVPNDSLSPADTYYDVLIELEGGYRWREFWSVGSAPDPLELGDVPRVDGLGPADLSPIVLEVTALPTPGLDWARHLVVLRELSGEQTLWGCLLQAGGIDYAWMRLGIGTVALEPFSSWSLTNASVETITIKTAPNGLRVNTTFAFGPPQDGGGQLNSTPLVAGRSYKLRFWINGAFAFQGGSGWSQRFAVAMDRGDGSFVSAGSFLPAAAPGWTEKEYAFTALGTTGRVQVACQTTQGTGGGPVGTFPWYFDNA